MSLLLLSVLRTGAKGGQKHIFHLMESGIQGINIGCSHSTTLSLWKMQSSLSTKKALSLDTILAEVIPTKKMVILVTFLRGNEVRGSKGALDRALRI